MNLGQYGDRPNVSRRAVFSPGGYLTAVTGTPVIASDATSIQTLFYTPDVNNGVPLLRAGQFEYTPFRETALPLSGLLANTIYDLVGFDDRGSVKFGWSPAWQTSTAGAGARGTGIGTNELLILDGLRVNKYPISVTMNGLTRSIGEKQGIALASISVGSVAGQTDFHRSYGQSRRWDAFNFYNRKRIFLKAGDGTASWTYAGSGYRAANAATANSMNVFHGLAEEFCDFRARSNGSLASTTGSVYNSSNGIGFNVTNASSGFSSSMIYNPPGNNASAWMSLTDFVNPPSLGSNLASILENKTSVGTITYSGTEANHLLSAAWHG